MRNIYSAIAVMVAVLFGLVALFFAAVGIAYTSNGFPPMVQFLGQVSDTQESMLVCDYDPVKRNMECMTFEDFAAKASALENEHSL